MVWDILFQAAAGFLLGATVGYGLAVIVDALSKKFAELWKVFAYEVQELWGYITDATEYLLAEIAQILDQNWSEIRYYLQQEFGYIQQVIVAIFRDNSEIIVAFVNPKSAQGKSVALSLGPAPGTNIQLPPVQNPLTHQLTL